MITLVIDELRSEVAPLYLKHPGQSEAQSAFVEMHDDGIVTAEWNAEIGNGVPSCVWHKRTLRFGVSPCVVGSVLADYLESEDAQALLSRIHEGHSVDWNGSNHVGTLNDDAQTAEALLKQELHELEQADIYTAAQWIQNDSLENVWPKCKTLAEAVEFTFVPNEPNQVILGDKEDAILQKALSSHSWPSEWAAAGRWDVAEALVKIEWEDTDAEGLADAVDAILDQPMATLDGFHESDRRDCVKELKQRIEAEATFAQGISTLKDAGKDLSWLPMTVKEELIKRRMDALEAWYEAYQQRLQAFQSL